MNGHGSPGSETAAQTVGMIAALSYIDGAGFHGIDMALGSASPTIDPSWSGHAHNALIAVAAVFWPEELQPQATQFANAAGRLAIALEAGETSAAVLPAREVHAAWHTLSSVGWNHLAKTAGIHGEGDTDRHQHPHQET
ncbi:hypothetical protein ACQCSX_17675 [Pseudarthrobacter sp. P1]|uniref:hypothetical protein n=1 Tax=Pseudarthrobacter sp. P1 TaxID=3418418 RepID=UPI003CFBA209